MSQESFGRAHTTGYYLLADDDGSSLGPHAEGNSATQEEPQERHYSRPDVTEARAGALAPTP